jgi:hypothetical protein
LGGVLAYRRAMTCVLLNVLLEDRSKKVEAKLSVDGGICARHRDNIN